MDDDSRRPYVPSAGAIFIGAWVLVFVAFAAQLYYTNIVSWRDAFARSAVDRLPWAIISPAIIALAWYVHSHRMSAARLTLLHGAGLIASLLLTEVLVQTVFLPVLFPVRPELSPLEWRPTERWHAQGVTTDRQEPPRFIPPKPPPEPFAPSEALAAAPSATPGWLVFAGLALRKSYIGLPLYLLIAALSHAFFFWRNLSEREGRVSELEERLMVARAQMLRLQLEPHFLFNTLNAIGTVVYRDAALADDLITQLSTLLRRLLEVRDEYTMPLEFEMQTLRAYVAIEKARFGERLEYEEQVSEAAISFPVPVMLLQPLAENAVRHGIEPSGRTGLLKVEASVRGDHLEIAVEDDGIGMRSGASANSGFGLGLASAKFRIQTLYGDAARLEVKARVGGGTRIEILLPRENRMRDSDHDEHE